MNINTKFKIGDLIIPKPPLKQDIGMIIKTISVSEKEQDLQVLLQTTGRFVWVSSLDIELLSYKKANISYN